MTVAFTGRAGEGNQDDMPGSGEGGQSSALPAATDGTATRCNYACSSLSHAPIVKLQGCDSICNHQMPKFASFLRSSACDR